jgi:peptide/nickel transport system substrate-binding protein
MKLRKSVLILAILSSILLITLLPIFTTNAPPVPLNEDGFPEPHPDLIPRDVYKYGGNFKIPRTNDWPSLNPFTWGNWQVCLNMYEQLVMVDHEWGASPWLAKSWEVSEDGLTWTFILDERATWSDGVPVTSEDVKFTFEEWDRQQMARQMPYTANIASIEAPDEHTVIFTTKEVDTTFVTRTLSWPSIVIVPKHIWENVGDWNTFMNDDPQYWVVNGPFIPKEWKKGEYLIIEHNDDYYRGRPYVDTITWIVIKMRDMQLMAFEKGEVDFFSPIYGNELQRFLTPEYHIWQVVDSGQPNWYFNTAKAPGNNTAFREAMSYLLDRDRILESAHYGFGIKAHHMMAVTYEQGNWVPPEDITHELDLVKAGEVLDAAGYLDVDDDGWRDGLDGNQMKLEFIISDYERYVKSTEIIVETLREAGLDVWVNVIGGGQLTAMRNQGYWHMCYGRYGPGGGDPLEPLSWQLTTGANWIGFYNDTYDEVWYEASLLFDDDERRPLIWELQRILAENYAFIPHICNVNLKAMRVDIWDPLPNSRPWGPFSNLQFFHYYNVHLKGTPGAKATVLTVSVDGQPEKQVPIDLIATVKDSNGNPVADETVDYYISGLTIGLARTNSDGTAVFTWVPTIDGTFDLKTVFTSTTEYQQSESETQSIVVGAGEEPEPEPEPDAGFQIPGYPLESVVAGLAVVTILLWYVNKNK